MILALILIPALAGLFAFFSRSVGVRRGLLVAAAGCHSVLTGFCWWQRPEPMFAGWLAVDAAALLFLSVTSALFLAAAIYAVGYLHSEVGHQVTDDEEGFLFGNAPEAVFVGCLLMFLAAMTFVAVSQHFGLLWIAIEATTLASAPDLFPSAPPLAGSHVEIPPDLFRRHRPGVARQLFPRRLRHTTGP